MESKNTGIVLKIIDYGENDLIVNIIDKNNKLINLFCPGTRKPSSKNRTSLFIGNIIEFSYFEAKLLGRLSKLKTSESKNNFLIESDMDLRFITSICSLMLSYEFINKDDRLFKLYESFFEKISKNDKYVLEYLTLLFCIIDDSNKNFNFNNCSICENHKKIKYFSFRAGGVICEDHSNYPLVNKEKLKIIYLLLKSKIEYLIEYRYTKALELFLENIAIEYLSENLGLYIKNNCG